MESAKGGGTTARWAAVLPLRTFGSGGTATGSGCYRWGRFCSLDKMINLGVFDMLHAAVLSLQGPQGTAGSRFALGLFELPGTPVHLSAVAMAVPPLRRYYHRPAAVVPVPREEAANDACPWPLRATDRRWSRAGGTSADHAMVLPVTLVS